MYKLNFSPEARNDLFDIKEYFSVELQNQSAAGNTVDMIMERIRKLQDFPEIGSALSSIIDIESDYRFLVCGNYTAFYRFADLSVYIDRILHGRRDFMNTLFGVSSVEETEDE